MRLSAHSTRLILVVAASGVACGDRARDRPDEHLVQPADRPEVAKAVPAPSPAIPAAQRSGDRDIPDVKLEVTVHEHAQGQISPAFRMFTLECLLGDCSLTTLVLNQCVAGTDSPIVDVASERHGDLAVTRQGSTLVAVHRAGLQHTVTLRFDLAMPDGTLRGFSGAYIKNSGLVGKVLTGDYVPLKGLSIVEKLDCPIYFPSLPEE